MSSNVPAISILFVRSSPWHPINLIAMLALRDRSLHVVVKDQCGRIADGNVYRDQLWLDADEFEKQHVGKITARYEFPLSSFPWARAHGKDWRRTPYVRPTEKVIADFARLAIRFITAGRHCNSRGSTNDCVSMVTEGLRSMGVFVPSSVYTPRRLRIYLTQLEAKLS